MRILLVPVHLDALCVTDPVSFIEPMADFSRLPYFDGQRDVNSGVPYLSEAILSEPFENRNLHLPPGIHLHWAMPDALTRGVSDGSKIKFPRLPNRWIVRRLIKEVTDKAWIIESDALSRTPPPELHPECLTTYPYPQDPQQPYRYIGRCFQKEDWYYKFNNHPTQQKYDPNAEYLDEGHALTAIGYGEPSFAAFYPNCASVFGFYDPTYKTKEEYPVGLAYDLIGWYSDTPQEIVTKLLPKGDMPISQWYLDAKTKLGWDIKGRNWSDVTDIPTDLMLFASLDFDEENDSSGTTKIVFGSTPSQALAAYLAAQVDANYQQPIQDQLEAILLAPALEHSQLDTGAKFASLRHEQSFNAVPGGKLWTLKANPELNIQPGETDTSAPSEPLPDELAFALDRLNQLQAALDGNNNELESLARQLYSDWVKYMICSYPPDGIPTGYPDSDAVGQYILTHSDQLQKRLADRGQMTNLDAARKQVEDILADLVLLRVDDIVDWQKILKSWLKLAQDRQAKVQLNTLQQTLADDFLSLPENERTRFSTAQTISVDDMKLLLNLLNQAIIQLADTGVVGRYTMKIELGGEFPDAIRTRVFYTLQDVPAPRYWVPTEPVALIAGNAAHHSDRFDLNHHLPCQILQLDLSVPLAPLAIDKIWEIFSYAPGDSTLQSLRAGFRSWEGQPWHPFLLEWIVALHPLQGSLITQNGRSTYDPLLITKNYALSENAVDLELLPSVKSFESTEKTFRGRSILTRHAENHLARGLATYLARNLNPDLRKDFPDKPSELETYLAANITGLRQQYEKGIPSKSTAQDKANDPLYSALRAYEQLLKNPSLSQGLDGFNQALLMQKQTLQLLPADPIGFEAVRTITDMVSKALSRGQDTAPQPLNDYNPIRSGSMELQHLRLVDVFGQSMELDVSSALSGESMPGLTHGPSGILQPPRLMQPARLNFRWLSARLNQSDGVTALEMSTHPGTSPICGWLVPNPLEYSVGVYDASGRSMGVIKKNVGTTETVEWDIAPGEFFRTVDQISNPHLASVVSELLTRAQSNPKFFTDFLDCIDDALENVEPEGKHHDSLALLVAHPLAVVRASLDLQLQGLPANDQDWTVFSQEIVAALGYDDWVRETHDFTKVQFPIRLGEYRRLNDGLIGFWQEASPPAAGKPPSLEHGFYLNDSEMAKINQDMLKKYNPSDPQIKDILQKAGDHIHKHTFLYAFPNGQEIWDQTCKDKVIEPVTFAPGDAGPEIIYYADNPDLMQSIDSPPLILTMLIDPRGAVHATCGIQPVKSIQVPAEMYADALRAIELTYFSTLILTHPEAIELPLPEETEYGWNWLEMTDEAWNESLPGTSPSLTADFGRLELREGWLKLNRTK